VAIRVVPGQSPVVFRFAQDVAHIDEGYMPHAEINVPGLILVGPFWVTLIGWFWVTPEGAAEGVCLREKAGVGQR
jgi:hydroxyacyl-ACP dehydratase HTD2-like protein with hotdog domain